MGEEEPSAAVVGGERRSTMTGLNGEARESVEPLAPRRARRGRRSAAAAAMWWWW